MWFIAFAIAGVLWLLIYLQMTDNQDNAVATLLIVPPEELNDNITTDQFSEDNVTSKIMMMKLQKNFQMVQSGDI